LDVSHATECGSQPNPLALVEQHWITHLEKHRPEIVLLLDASRHALLVLVVRHCVCDVLQSLSLTLVKICGSDIGDA
jgi:hypothetical protein